MLEPNLVLANRSQSPEVPFSVPHHAQFHVQFCWLEHASTRVVSLEVGPTEGALLRALEKWVMLEMDSQQRFQLVVEVEGQEILVAVDGGWINLSAIATLLALGFLPMVVHQVGLSLRAHSSVK